MCRNRVPFDNLQIEGPDSHKRETIVTAYREVDFIPADWVERAAWWPGLQVYSQLIRVPVNPCRRETDFVVTTLVDVVERLLQEVFDEPFQSVDLDEMQTLLNSLETSE